MQSKCEANCRNDKVVDSESVHLQSFILKVVVINGPFPSASSPLRSETFNMRLTPAPCRVIIGPLSCRNQSVSGQSCNSSFVRKMKRHFAHRFKKCKVGRNGQQVHYTTDDGPTRVRESFKSENEYDSLSSSKCVSMPSAPGTEQMRRAFRKVLHLLTRQQCPPSSFCRNQIQTNIQSHLSGRLQQ